MQSTFKVTEKKKKKTSFCEPTVLMGGGGGVSEFICIPKQGENLCSPTHSLPMELTHTLN